MPIYHATISVGLVFDQEPTDEELDAKALEEFEKLFASNVKVGKKLYKKVFLGDIDFEKVEG